MKIQAGQAQAIISNLNVISEIEMPVKTSYMFAKLSTEIQPAVDAFEKQRVALLKKHSEVDSKGKLVLDDEGNAKVIDMDAFQEEYNKIAREEIEIDADPIPISAIGDISIKPSVMIVLLPLLKDDNDPSDEDKKG